MPKFARQGMSLGSLSSDAQEQECMRKEETRALNQVHGVNFLALLSAAHRQACLKQPWQTVH